ncbi:hypothetical protein AUL38_14635 [Leucobacter sp. G161]|nr:hypothetical protein AUL38_14635 [Leucobacter sp. G161]
MSHRDERIDPAAHANGVGKGSGTVVLRHRTDDRRLPGLDSLGAVSEHVEKLTGLGSNLPKLAAELVGVEVCDVLCSGLDIKAVECDTCGRQLAHVFDVLAVLARPG